MPKPMPTPSPTPTPTKGPFTSWGPPTPPSTPPTPPTPRMPRVQTSIETRKKKKGSRRRISKDKVVQKNTITDWLRRVRKEGDKEGRDMIGKGKKRKIEEDIEDIDRKDKKDQKKSKKVEEEKSL